MKSNLSEETPLIPDIFGIGYPALRSAFNDFLGECQKHLTKADFDRATEELGIDQLSADMADFFCDAALYSRPDPGRKRRDRAIDRIVKKVSRKRDTLVAFIAQALPNATFSIFEFKAVNADGSVTLHDLIDHRQLQFMDHRLAANGKAGLLFAARFVELGSWNLGFGIVVPLRKSEALALLVTTTAAENLSESREALSQVIYASRIHRLDLVKTALEPLIDLFVERIEQPSSDIVQLSAQFASVLNRR